MLSGSNKHSVCSRGCKKKRQKKLRRRLRHAGLTRVSLLVPWCCAPSRSENGVPLSNGPVIHQPGPSPSVAPPGAGGRAPAPVGMRPPRDLRCSSDPRRTPPPPHAHRRMGARPLAVSARLRPGTERAAVVTEAPRRAARVALEAEREPPPLQAADTPRCAAQSRSLSGHPRRRSRRRDPPSSACLSPSPRRTLPLTAALHSPPSPSPITAPCSPPPPPHAAAMAFVGTFVPSPAAVLSRGATARVAARPVARSATTVTMRASKSVPFMEVPPALAANPNMPGNVGTCDAWVLRAEGGRWTGYGAGGGVGRGDRARGGIGVDQRNGEVGGSFGGRGGAATERG